MPCHDRTKKSGDQIDERASGRQETTVNAALEVDGGNDEWFCTGKQARASVPNCLVKDIGNNCSYDRNSNDGPRVWHAKRYRFRDMRRGVCVHSKQV